MRIHGAVLFLSLSFVAPLLAAEKTHGETNPSPRWFVKPLDLPSLGERFRALPPRSQALLQLYLQGAQRYVLTREDGAFPDRGTEHWRNLAERAHGAAVLAALASQWPDELRQRCRRQSLAFLKDFVAQFEKDHHFGNAWQSSWWVAEMATAAWFLWDRLDPPLQGGVADMVAYHADYIAGKKPGARIALDTEAETVAWNSTILALAANMMPKHPHNVTWQEAARRYAYTVFATPHDLHDGTPGDDGKSLKDWVVGANIHDDFTLENHNRFHIDYEYTCYRFLIYGAAMYRLGGKHIPDAFRHHAWDVYDKVLLRCTNASGFGVYVSDNDWKRYHDWTESAAVHGYLALIKSSPLASALEEQALKHADAYWHTFPENFSYANPYVCGRAWTPRIADIVLLHLLLPPPPEPAPAAEVEAHLQGVYQKHDVRLLTHYSRAGSFRSFYWGPGPTVRHIEPRDNAWMMLPLTINYGIAIDGKLGSDVQARVFARKGADWFWGLRNDVRGDHAAFVSLPDEIVVVMAAVSGAALKGARKLDCMVGVEKPHKTFTIFYDHDQARYHYGQPAWERSDKVDGLLLRTRWVNLADSMGFVVADLSQGPSCMILPRPGKRDALSLHHVERPGHDQYFVTVVFPNQNHQRTAERAPQVIGSYRDGILTCLVPPYIVWANFSDKEARLQLPQGIEPAGPVTCPPNRVGILHVGREDKSWRPLE